MTRNSLLTVLCGFLLCAWTEGQAGLITNSPGSDRPLPWTFTELYRLGGADTGFALFTEAHATTVGADRQGRLYILDRSMFRVIVFDSLGRPLRSQGRRGAGPGEHSFARKP